MQILLEFAGSIKGSRPDFFTDQCFVQVVAGSPASSKNPMLMLSGLTTIFNSLPHVTPQTKSSDIEGKLGSSLVLASDLHLQVAQNPPLECALDTHQLLRNRMAVDRTSETLSQPQTSELCPMRRLHIKPPQPSTLNLPSDSILQLPL